MKKSHSVSSEQEQIEKHKKLLDDKQNKKFAKLLARFQDMEGLMDESNIAAWEMVEQQKSIGKKLASISTTLKKMNDNLVEQLKLSRTMNNSLAEELADTSLFDSSPVAQPAKEGYQSMSENMADMFPDIEYDHPVQDNTESVVRVVNDLADDLDDFADEFKATNQEPELISTSQADRLRDIDDARKDETFLMMKSIDRNVASIASYYTSLKNKKTGKTGNPTEDDLDEGKDKPLTLTDMLLGWLGLKKLSDIFKKAFGKKLFAGLQKKLAKFVGSSWYKSLMKLVEWPFKFVMTNLKIMWRKLSKAVTKVIAKPIASFVAGLHMQMTMFIESMVSSFSKVAKKFGGSKIGGWLMGKFSAITGLLKKLLPSSLTARLAQFAKISGKGLLKGLGKFAMGAARFVGKFLGTLLFMAWDFFSGFTDSAVEENLGIKKEAITFIDRIHSGVLSLLSGMTLGIIDAKTIGEKTKMVGDVVWKYITEPVLNFFERIGDSISKVMDDFASLLPTSWKDMKKVLTLGFGGDEKEEAKPKTAYEMSASYLNKRNKLHPDQKNMSASPVVNPLTTISKADGKSMLSVPVKNVVTQPQGLNTATASMTDKQGADARKKPETKQAPVQPVVIQQQSGDNKSSGVSRSVNSGRSDISRAIGRGSQFSFGG